MDNRKQFMIIDISIFSILAILSEFASYQLLYLFNSAGFIFSFSLLLGLIAVYRWGLPGTIVYILSGLSMIFINSHLIANLLFYLIANLFFILTPLFFKVVSRNKVKTKLFYLFLYILIPITFLSIGKGLVIYLLEGHFYGFTDYFASQLFTLVITFIVLNMVIHTEGLLENMRTYIQD